MPPLRGWQEIFLVYYPGFGSDLPNAGRNKGRAAVRLEEVDPVVGVKAGGFGDVPYFFRG